jgi:hypothetical protein
VPFNNQQSVDISSSGDNTVVAALAGQSIYVRRLFLSAATEVTVQFKSDTTALSGPTTILSMLLDDSGGRASDPWLITQSGEALVISLGSAVQVGGTIWFDYGPG